jgi:subtilisin family serine protease/subtilisin-like proprotein convertase family protein
MRIKTRTWCLISLLLFVAAGVCWWFGNLQQARHAPEPTNAAPTNATMTRPFGTNPTPAIALLTGNGTNAAAKTAADSRSGRLTNSSKKLSELMRSDTAILLRNALLDTAEPALAEIPETLRSQGDPGSYIVQSRGVIGDAFRAEIQAAHGSIVSYIPNNAYLVEGGADVARTLSGAAGVSAVLPYEPYYKLEPTLLALVLENQPLSSDAQLHVTLLPNGAAEGKPALEGLGARVIAEMRTPFGPMLTVAPQSASLAAIAQVKQVQGVEPVHRRVLANDITRVVVGVSENTTNATNYLGLTGTNVLVNINDSGVDATHPDLKDRVFSIDPAYLTDPEGHGTHVAGIIASSGSQSSTVTNAIGSVTNADFRGMAPGAELFVLPMGILTGLISSDIYLQETAASTNAFLSNNSWVYEDASDYDISAATYDAAVRDALPEKSGSQPLLFVFAAGNHGGGAADGTGGEPDTIRSPATAKNVITVGALDHFRNITNEAYMPDDYGYDVTNAWFLGDTDSDDQVASYSGRGNVGVGTEGDNGRFKPDVVAPGSYLVSTRATDWLMDTNPPKAMNNQFYNQESVPGLLNNYSIYVPDNAARLILQLTPSVGFSNAFPEMPIYVRHGDFPDASTYDFVGTNEVELPRDFPISAGDWYYSVGNNSGDFVRYDVQTSIIVSNAYGNYYQVLKQINDDCGPYYRYETGTSMSAPVVSGILALMKEFFEQKLPEDKRMTNSPALMKALVVNGAHSVSGRYDVSPNKTRNIEGWGIVDLTNSIPMALTNGVMTNGPLVLVEQSVSNAVATTQSKSWAVAVSPDATNSGLKFTLVWTDPPGNPNATIKLVNDLDLVVTNLDTGDVYVGNDIPEQSDYNEVQTTNSVGRFDVVNNVENVFIREARGTNYSVTVLGRRVNVNAVTGNTNLVVQDYALVASCGDLTLTNGLGLTALAPVSSVATTNALVARVAKGVTNGLALVNERVGANSALASTNRTLPMADTNGTVVQWNFYVFTNSISTNNPTGITNGPNVAFITFQPPNLSSSRLLDADIDLYVSTNPALTNLDAAAIASADKSTSRGGTELVFYTNAPLDRVYYIGVKSEDQKASEYGFIGLSSQLPFSQNINGSMLMQVFPFYQDIPDGAPDRPGRTNAFAIGTFPMKVGRIVVTNIVTSQDLGDIFTTLSHNQSYVTLFNHNLNNTNLYGTNMMFVFDDSNNGGVSFSQPSDGPGSLLDFKNQQAMGVWMLNITDNSMTHTSRVESCSIWIDPFPALTGLVGRVEPKTWQYYGITVPVEATNLMVTLWDLQPELPLDLFVRGGDYPGANAYDKHVRVDPTLPFDPTKPTLELGLGDSPPLVPGQFYYIGVYNPNNVAVDFRIDASLAYDLSGGLAQTFVSRDTPMSILDDALTVSTNFVPLNRQIIDVRVGLRIDHPRLSDLSIHLVSPQGTRVLLDENRGQQAATQFGYNIGTNFIYATFAELTNYSSTPIKFAQPQFTNSIIGPIVYQQGFETVPPGNYPTGPRFDNWLVIGNPVTVLTDPLLANSGTNFLEMSGSRMRRVLPTQAGKDYELTFAYRKYPSLDGLVGWWPGEGNGSDVFGRQNALLTNGVVFENAMVGQGMRFNGLRNYGVLTGDPAALSTAHYTVEAWVKPLGPINSPQSQALVFGQAFGRAQLVLRPGVNGVKVGWQFADTRFSSVSVESAGVIPFNQFSHLAGTWDGSSLRIYINGVLDATLATPSAPRLSTAGFYIGGFNSRGAEGLLIGQYLNGVIDELGYYNLALDATNIAAIYAAGADGKCSMQVSPEPCKAATTVTLSGVSTNEIFGDAGWQVFKLPFTAPAANVALNLQNTLGNMLIDDVVLREKGSIYQAEESLDVFKDESSQGAWRLEVEDTRVGPLAGAPPAPKILSWQLQFIVATPAISVVTLTNSIAYTNLVGGSDTKYFKVIVPFSAHFATNTLTGTGDLILIGNRAGLPTGDSLLDDYYVDNRGVNGGEYLLLSTGSPLNAPLQPGGVYYLGVRNKDTRQTNSFSIRVDFDQVDQPANVITLTSGVPVTRSINSGNTADYFRFTVTSIAYQAVFDLFPTNGDVNLVLRKGGAEFDPLPTMTRYDYASTQPGTATDEIVVTTNSIPVSLSPGVWYLGVYNADTNIVDYSIRATEYLGIATNVVQLTNNVPLNAEETYGPYLTNFYRLSITDTNPSFRIDLYNLSGSADVVLRRGMYPTTNLFDVSSTRPGTIPETITVTTNATVTDLNGDWYLAVINRTTNTVDFTLRAIVTPQVTPLADTVEVTDMVKAGPGWHYYSFNVSTDAVAASFEVRPQDGDAALYVIKATTSLYPWPTLTSYSYTSDQPGTNRELVTVSTNSTPTKLAGGTWYVGVYNPGTSPVTYQIMASELRPSVTPIITLVNNVILNRPALTNCGVAFYQFQVSAQATQAIFETFFATGNLSLYARQGLPLPTPVNAHYNSTNAGAADEMIRVYTNSQPVALGPGWWFLTVSNADAGPVKYSIRAVELSATPLAIVPQIDVSATSVCLTWSSLTGEDYTIVGKNRITDPAWSSLAVCTASNQLTTICLPLPSTNQYYFWVRP